MKDRVKQLLIKGYKASEISGIVGCSPSFISQLLKDEEFLKEVEAGKLVDQAEKTEETHLDNRYERVEHKLLDAMIDTMESASLGEITRAVEVINKRKEAKRAPPAQTNTGIQVNVVSLVMPAHALPSQQAATITMNEKQEIIAIGGRALSPMSSDAVKNLFASKMPVPVAITAEDM